MSNLDIVKKHIDSTFNVDTREHIGALTCINSLNEIDKIILEYEHNINDKIDILLSIFGLFQALYVGIDSMYDLVSVLFSNKDIVNINRNPLLKKLRSIRNDCIGHPTNREYTYNSFGFCQIQTSKLTKTKFYYDTFLFTGLTYKKVVSEINIMYLISEYKKEKNKLIKELNYIINNSISFYEIKNLIDKLNDSLDSDTIDYIISFIINKKLLSSHSKLIFRLNLIKNNLYLLNNDSSKIFSTSIKFQIKQSYSLVNYNDYKFEIPTYIKQLKEYISSNKLPNNHLNDFNSVFFFPELDSLEANCSDINIKNLINIVKNTINYENHYIIYECIFK